MKIVSDMPIPHSLGKQFITPRGIEVVKQYKDQDTFRGVSAYKGQNKIQVKKITSKKKNICKDSIKRRQFNSKTALISNLKIMTL